MATKKKSGWASLPAKAPKFDFSGDALKKAWKDLHAGDAERVHLNTLSQAYQD